MAISLIDNLKIQNKKQNVERDSFATIADMVSYSPNYLPNIFHAMCEETGKMYVYNVNNDEDLDLGKWRVLEGSGSGTAEVPIEKIKVNGELQTPVNKVVDITVPDITGLATETYVDNKVADYTKTVDLADVAMSGSYNDLADKPTIPSLDGYAKTTDIPTKISELENDSNYLSSIPEEYVTDTELNAKGYITEHQDISGKVDKVEGKSLISNTEIARLASVDNYDDTDIKAEIAKKADTTSIPSKVSDLENDSKYQTESDVTTTLTDYATKTYVGEQIANAEHLKREIVTVLPSDTEASDNIIYMLKVESATGNDKYQEYMKIDGTVQIVGDTSVDLTDYAKTTDIPTNTSDLTNDSGFLTEHQDISGKVDKVAGKGLSTNDLTDELKSSYDDAVTAKHTHENGTVLDKFSESNEGVLLFNGEKIESELVLDSTPTKDSKNYVNSGSVYSSLFETKQRTVIDTPENYVSCASSDDGALEVVADDITPTTTQVTLSVVQAFVPTAQVGEYYQHIDEVSHLEDYEDTIYREKDDSYSSKEIDEKIKEVNDKIMEIASGGLKPLSLTEYRSFMDNLVISADGYVAP